MGGAVDDDHGGELLQCRAASSKRNSPRAELEPYRLARVGRGVLPGPGLGGVAGWRAGIIRRGSPGALSRGRIRVHALGAAASDQPVRESGRPNFGGRSWQEVVALGATHGGAHANIRWTVWAGSTQRLDEDPQTFETFGGPDAGGLLDIVATSDGPVIAGTWAAGEGGLDAAVWLPRGRRWLRQESDGTALANTPQIQVNPRAASAAGAAMIFPGSVITFNDGVEQRAAIWTWPTRSSAWTLQQLPDAGTHSEALSSRCAQTCWVSGHADGRVALWSFDPANATGTATRDSTLPSMEIDTDGPGPRTVLSGDRPGVLFSHAGSTRLVVSDGHDSWQTFTAPAGSVLDATTVGDRLYAIIRSDGAGLGLIERRP